MVDAPIADRASGRTHLATRLMQAAIAVVLAFGAVTRNVGVVVNALFALGVTLLPAVVERDPRVTLAPRFAVLVTAAVLLHVLGMVGLYRTVAWWDHLTHTLSAALVAAVGYAAVRVLDDYAADLYLPRWFLVCFTFLLTLALGVTWEVLEFAARTLARVLGFEPVLVQYGLDDTLLDLVFDGVGGAVAALLGARRLSPFVGRFADRFGEA